MKEKETYQSNRNSQEHLDDNELAQYAEYLRNESAGIPDKLIEHVASCGFCRAELMAITDMLDAMPDMAEESVAPETGDPLAVDRRPVFPRIKWLRAAASIAAIFLLAWIVLQLIPSHPVPEPLASNTIKDSIPHKDSVAPNLLTPNLLTSDSSTRITALPDTVRYASAFLPNPVYENLVGAKYRSGNDPKVVDPFPQLVFAPGDTLKLSWTPDSDDEYKLLIIDNKANPVKEIPIGKEALLAWKIDLKPGLYYWKFLGKEEMWKVGKFKVIRSLNAP